MSDAGRVSYRDIGAELSRRIADRIWAPGALIPGEEALAQEFGCARATVNRALQQLARDGIVERKRKSGTRIAISPVREARLAIPLVRQEIEGKGGAYRYALLSRAVEPLPEGIAARMGLTAADPLLHVRALHWADGAPYQYEDRWIDLDTVPAAGEADFSAVSPNEWLVSSEPFSRAEYVFRAAAASEEETALLELSPGQPVFLAERLTWLLARPITFVRMAHPPSHRVVTRL